MVLRCGLLQAKSKEPVPLEDIKMDVEVNGLAAHTRLTLEYYNKEDNPIEAVYVMPADDEASVCGFRAKVGDRSIVAKVQEKQEARETYDDAIASGQTAYLMEESDESSDILIISIGNLPVQSSTTIEIDFVMELRMEGNDRAVFDFPQVLLPRYTPSSDSGNSGDGSSGQNLTAEVPRIQPGEKMPYKFSFSCDVYTSCALKIVESPDQQLSVIYSDDKRGATVTLAKEHDFEKNIQLHIVTDEPFQAYGVVEQGLQGSEHNEFMSNPVVMLNFFPTFPERKVKETLCEMIFIVDRSGSMSGSPMASARETLLLCLKSLPSDCYFNVIGFGSSFETLFPKSVKYNDESLDKACQLSKCMEADLGGTEIMKPMQWVFSQPIIKGYSRQVFLLTDGGVSNTQQVIKTVADNAKMARTFSIGIGQGVSTSLVKGVAKAGKGKCEFVTGKERLQKKVIMLLKCALQPALRNLEVEWKIPQNCTVKQIPVEIGSLFEGEKLVVYARMQLSTEQATPETENFRGDAVIKGGVDFMSDQTVLVSCAISFEMKLPSSKSRPLPTIHHLAGKKAIKEFPLCDKNVWGNYDQTNEEMIKISKDSNVISPHTSFIAVDEKTANPIPGPMIRRDIPMMYMIPAMALKSASLSGMYCSAGAPVPRLKTPSLGISSKMHVKRKSEKAMVGRNYAIAACRMDCELNNEAAEDLPVVLPVEDNSLKENAMIYVISLQKAAGNWVLSDELINLLGQTREKLNNQSVKEKLSLSDECDGCLLATALVLVWLVEKHGEKNTEWEIIAEKAKKWMDKNMKTGLTRSQIMSIAYTVFVDEMMMYQTSV